MSELHTTPLDTLLAAANAIQAGRGADGRALLAAPLGDLGPRGRLDALLRAALLARIDGDAEGRGNLYAGDDRDQDRMIAAFALLAERTPMIRFGYAAANLAILRAAAGAEALHVVDIGVGAGVQWLDLIDRVAALASRPRVRITGVDVPDAAGEVARALRELGERLTAHAEARGVDLRFVGLARPIEAMEATEAFDRRPGEVLAINASLALHHVAADEDDGERGEHGDGASPRARVLRRLAELRPDLLTLIEPEADHNHRDLRRRLAGAREHYGLVFAILDEVLADDPAIRGALERGFFGREVANILGADGAARVERHEPLARWQRRLRGAGFTPVAAEPERVAAELTGGAFGLARRGDAVQLTWRERPVLSFSAWKGAR
ncbi:MAG: GRAS family protein [Nannocystaceae bacterium]